MSSSDCFGYEGESLVGFCFTVIYLGREETAVQLLGLIEVVSCMSLDGEPLVDGLVDVDVLNGGVPHFAGLGIEGFESEVDRDEGLRGSFCEGADDSEERGSGCASRVDERSHGMILMRLNDGGSYVPCRRGACVEDLDGGGVVWDGEIPSVNPIMKPPYQISR